MYLWKHDHALVDKLGHDVGLPENVEFLSLQLQLKKYIYCELQQQIRSRLRYLDTDLNQGCKAETSSVRL